MIEGTATPAQVSAFLTAMRFKSESVTELAAFTATARQYVPPVPVRAGLGVVDVPVYAGEARNVSRHRACCDCRGCSRAVLLLHGVDGPPDRQGVSSVLKLLGIPVDLTAKLVGPGGEEGRGLPGSGPVSTRPSVGFWKCGRKLGVRNFSIRWRGCSTLLGPVPQVIGLSHPPYFEKTVEALRMLSCPACAGHSRGRGRPGTVDREHDPAVGAQRSALRPSRSNPRMRG